MPSRDRIISRSTQPTSCRAPALAFEHKPYVHAHTTYIVTAHRSSILNSSTLVLTRSQLPGVWRVMAYDNSSITHPPTLHTCPPVTHPPTPHTCRQPADLMCLMCTRYEQKRILLGKQIYLRNYSYCKPSCSTRNASRNPI